MNRSPWLALALLALLLAPAAAQAQDMNVALNRLKTPAQPGTECSPSTADGTRDFCGDDDAWRRLMSQLGMTMAPPIMTPARTVGPGGFSIGFETWVTGIDYGEDYWELGTEGDAEAGAEGRNRFVNKALTWSRLAVRKGFPFGFQLGLSVGHGFATDYWTWGVEVQWSLFEGFRTGVGWIPDVSVRGMVQTMTGDGEYNLTVPSVDLTVSKPLVAGKMVEFTPFVGGQLLWMVADSELVDLTPGTNAFDQCRPEAGPPAEGDASTIRCMDDPQDFNNNYVFPEIRAIRWRLAFGLKFRYEILTLTGAFHFDVKEPADADSAVAFDSGSSLPRQWTVSFGAGLEL